MLKTNFTESDFIKFEDPKNLMIQLFGISCSLCGVDEIDFVDAKAPKTLGSFTQNVLAEKPEISDDDLNDLVEPQIDAWQELDDHNVSIGIPTFLCDTCYHQLLDGEVSISGEF